MSACLIREIFLVHKWDHPTQPAPPTYNSLAASGCLRMESSSLAGHARSLEMRLSLPFLVSSHFPTHQITHFRNLLLPRSHICVFIKAIPSSGKAFLGSSFFYPTVLSTWKTLTHPSFCWNVTSCGGPRECFSNSVNHSQVQTSIATDLIVLQSSALVLSLPPDRGAQEVIMTQFNLMLNHIIHFKPKTPGPLWNMIPPQLPWTI